MDQQQEQYSPEQLLNICRVQSSCFAYGDGIKQIVIKILATFATERDPTTLIEKLSCIIDDVSQVSIGTALDRLYWVANLGPELRGNKDGLDALIYHLCKNQCTNGIQALNKVLRRFETDQLKTKENQP